MPASLKVTFFNDEDSRQYMLDLDITDDGAAEVYMRQSVVCTPDEPRPASYESYSWSISAIALDAYYKGNHSLYPPTIIGILNVLDAYGPEWAGVFQQIR